MMFYSEFGEDKWLVEHGDLPFHGVFVDVGAGGYTNSNSLHFEEKGWKVLCIEPDKRHPGLSSRKLVDHSVVGEKDGFAEFVLHRFPVLSGLHHGKAESVTLPMHTLNTILENYSIDKIDVLSIDVEGHEIAVLSGFDLEVYKPSYIIIEHTNQFKGNGQSDIHAILDKAGYEQVFISQSNMIMKRKGGNNG